MNKDFMESAKKAAEQSRCLRSKVGAVLIKNNEIISEGHNGPIKDFIDCIKTGCVREKNNIPHGENNDICYGVCAEQNVILECAAKGISCLGGEIYTTRQPCSVCVKAMKAAGIKKVFYSEPRFDEFSIELLDKSGIEAIKID